MSPFQIDAFTETILHFDAHGHPQIDLRVPLTLRETAILAQLGLTEPFGICTAENPGFLQSPAENMAASRRLERDLALWDVYTVAMAACSPDRTHCERSIAVISPCETLLVLARQYKQLAIFWFDGVRFWIVPTAPSNPKIVLPVYKGL